MNGGGIAERAAGDGVRRLERLMRELRGPDGCPWDREQTLETLRACLLEETHELLDAMESGDADEHAEELGDVLLQVVFQSQIRAERGDFGLDDVAHGVCEKLIRRHPHVFAGSKAGDSAEVLRAWERIKKGERGGNTERKRRSALAGVPRALPALLRAQRVLAKCQRSGFDWDGAADARAALGGALSGLDSARGNAEATIGETERAVGGLLFAAAALARELEVDAESALRAAVRDFSSEFEEFERANDKGE